MWEEFSFAPTTGYSGLPRTSFSTRRSADDPPGCGKGYPESGSKNKSAIHWDMVCDLRKGGEVRVDGTLFLKDGKILI